MELVKRPFLSQSLSFLGKTGLLAGETHWKVGSWTHNHLQLAAPKTSFLGALGKQHPAVPVCPPLWPLARPVSHPYT